MISLIIKLKVKNASLLRFWLRMNMQLPSHDMQEKNSPDGLEGPARRFVNFGGGASVQQLTWLTEQLADAHSQEQLVIVCCHLPLNPETCELSE